MTDAIISIKPRHANNILSGDKTVELRTRNINLPVGSRLWVYTTMPVGEVSFSVEVGFVECLPPSEIWKKFGRQICISKGEFINYTRGRNLVTAIGLRKVEPLERGICLDTLRTYEKNFQPPQFFSRLYPDRALASIFT